MQPDDGNILRQRLFHDLSGATSARGRLAIPDGNEKVGLLKNQSPDSFIGNVRCIARAVDLENRGGFGEQSMELIARGLGWKVAAVFFFMEWEWGLQVCAESEPGVGDNSVRTFSERRKDAQKRRFG